MNDKKTMQYMGLDGNSWKTKKQLSISASNSIYYWWWRFLRLSPEFWYASKTNRPILNSQIQRTFELTGGFPSHSFNAWWNQYGINAFAEKERADCVELVDLNNEKLTTDERSFIFKVPGTLNKREITSQFKALLNQVHRGRNYDVEAYSNAELKLFNHKYNLTTIERQYWVLLYKIIYPKTPHWVIGDRLQLAPHLNLRYINRKTVERKAEQMFLQLQSHTWRYHSNAENVRWNALTGSFPNYTRSNPKNEEIIFDSKYDDDFTQMADELKSDDSPWQIWIKRHFQNALHEKIKSLNKFDQRYMQNSQYSKSFKKFVMGTLEL
jgi:hypothetical protein